MKVLQINSVCGIRSTGRICTDIAEFVENEGDICKIAYGREKVPEKYEKYSIKISSNFDVYINVLQTRIFDNTGFGTKYYTKKFIKWIDDYKPDIIHLHNIHGYYINMELLFNYLKKNEIPVVWTLHDCWSFTGHCVHFEGVACTEWKENGCKNCIQKKQYPASYLLDNSDINFKKKKALITSIEKMVIVTPSEWLANLVKQSFLKCFPVQVINNGIDLSKFKPVVTDFRKVYHLENKIVLLGVASVWSKQKGFDDFCKLASMLNEDYVLIMVGVSNKQKDMLPNKVLCFNQTNSINELAMIYSAADFFLNLSYEDTYPTVNLEAQACGTPVITYNTGGSRESVCEELVVEQGNISAILELIKAPKKDYINLIKADKKNTLYDYYNLYNRILLEKM